ncbi:hypothetical protein [Leifsonia sp. WHRI 6310E]|uniref:hypothetical protein n=1 Tax=Leifsonia sp. WHRI 6310E TaxID=3162562 RepID=UPI0032EB8657
MSDDLEARYRRALRWYPDSWRRRHADAVVGILLDRAEQEGRSAPARGEALDLAVQGSAARLPLVVPRDVRAGAATLALGYGTVFAALQFWSNWWAPLSSGRRYLREQAPSVSTFGPFLSPGVVLAALWVLALALVLAGAVRSARVLLVASAVVAAILPTVNGWIGGWDGPSTTNLLFLGFAALIAASAAPRRRALLVGVPFWALLLVGVFGWNAMLVPDFPSDRQFWLVFAARIPPAVMVVALTVVAMVLLLARRTAAIPVFAIAAAPWVCGWYVATIRDNPAGALSWGVAAVFAVAAAAAVAIGLRRAGVRVSIENRPTPPKGRAPS